jgi:hypothetical protein
MFNPLKRSGYYIRTCSNTKNPLRFLHSAFRIPMILKHNNIHPLIFVLERQCVSGEVFKSYLHSF